MFAYSYCTKVCTALLCVLPTQTDKSLAVLLCFHFYSHLSPTLFGQLKLYGMIHLLAAIGLSPGGSGTVQYSTHLHTNNTQNDTKQTIHRMTQQLGQCGPCPVLIKYVYRSSCKVTVILVRF